MKIFEAKLKKTNTGYLVGNKLTWADLYLFNTIDRLGENKQVAFEHTPTIKKHLDDIKNIPNIKNWLTIRPETSL
jgi:glutathione S-transferase